MNGETAPAPPPGRWRAALLLVLLLPVAGWVFYESQRTFRADWASASARHKVVQWVAGTAQPKDEAEWQQAHADLQRSLGITPDDPGMQERMGDLYAVAGQRDWAEEPRRRAHFAEAARYYQQAIALRPSEPGTWAMLALARQSMGAPPASVHEAWARAQKQGPYEGHVQPMLMQVVLAGWDDATPAMQAWAKALFDNGDAGTRSGINAMAKRYGLVFTPDPVAAP